MRLSSSPFLRVLPAIVLLLGALSHDSLSAAIVVLRPQAEAASSVVQLKDIAEISESDPEQLARLQQLTLAPAPAAGQTLRLDFATIRSRLQAHGIDPVSLEFGGSAVVTVSASARGSDQGPAQALSGTVPGWQRDRVQSLLSTAVVQHLERLAPELGRISVEVTLNERDVEPLLLARANSVRIVGGRPPWNAPQTFLVQFSDRDGAPQETRFACRLAARPLVPTARYHLPKGHMLRADDVIYQQVNTIEEKYPAAEELIGMETTRGLRQGEAISSRSVQTVPLIRSGNLVTVYSRIGNISVKRVMKARGDGVRGETVLLEALDTRDKVEARVSGVNEAEILNPNVTTQAPMPPQGVVRVHFEQPQPQPQPQHPAGTIVPAGGFPHQSGASPVHRQPAQSGPAGPPRSVP